MRLRGYPYRYRLVPYHLLLYEVIKNEKPCKSTDYRVCDMDCRPKSGVGEIRTPVQTSNQNAFYMLSFCSIVDVQLTKNRPLHA